MSKVDENGFTLIEVLISISILVVVLIPMLNLFMNSTYNYLEAGDDTKLLKYGEMIVEEIKVNPPSEEVEEYVDENEEVKYQITLEPYEAGEEIIMTKYTVTVFFSGQSPENGVVLTIIQ